ncbi:hypothetical protein PR202_gb25730 [Eleusine coracana subsp. coracana]|uniref:Protein kinase domain-containing protein n=1 Tax=Eleusine coracana subsp. coracana TaxID=191504 RepID=A0AAV5FQ16_ELECO|nr:hypothetical protein PR202_gb25730 [Eleusine coracana subsp. coracana]
MPGRKQKRFVLCALLYFCSLDLASFTFADDQFIYSGFIQANLSLDGTATITRDGLLELTNGGFNLKGHAFYPTPLSLRMSPSVELDTIQNSEFQDINDNHVGINVNSLHFSIGNTAPRIDITKLPKLQNVGTRSKSSKILLIVPPVAIVLLIFVSGAIIIPARKKLAYSELQEDWEIEFGAHRFSYKDLFRATDGFKNKNMLGAGGFGKVYKGVLPTSLLQVAVKRLSHESKQGMKEFINEIVSIGHLRHRNLVQLLGYCRRKGELLLVYEYMPNGSLDKYIYYEQNSPSLDWATRNCMWLAIPPREMG